MFSLKEMLIIDKLNVLTQVLSLTNHTLNKLTFALCFKLVLILWGQGVLPYEMSKGSQVCK